MKIYVDLTGRVGNQMFQYALARRIQNDYGGTIVLNDHFLRKNSDFKEELSLFKLCENVIFSHEKLPSWVYRHNIFNRILTKYLPNVQREIKNRKNSLYWYKNEYYNFKILQDKDVYISGYFQSEKYFDNISNLLKQEMQPKNGKIEDRTLEFIKLIKDKKNSVCITIRRGNYVSNEKLKRKYYVADKNYFDRAVKKIRKKIDEPVFFVFSDDIEWAKNNIKLDAEVYFEPDGLKIHEKMKAMSSCEHFIISNSTFSWWAQYLGESEEKVVVSPSKWYADGEKTDIFQSNWIQI